MNAVFVYVRVCVWHAAREIIDAFFLLLRGHFFSEVFQILHGFKQ